MREMTREEVEQMKQAAIARLKNGPAPVTPEEKQKIRKAFQEAVARRADADKPHTCYDGQQETPRQLVESFLAHDGFYPAIKDSLSLNPPVADPWGALEMDAKVQRLLDSMTTPPPKTKGPKSGM